MGNNSNNYNNEIGNDIIKCRIYQSPGWKENKGKQLNTKLQ